MPTSQHSHNPKTPKSIKQLFAERKKALFKKPRKTKPKPSRFARIIDTLYNVIFTFTTFISWSISWLLSLLLWYWLFFLLYREFGISLIDKIPQKWLEILNKFF